MHCPLEGKDLARVVLSRNGFGCPPAYPATKCVCKLWGRSQTCLSPRISLSHLSTEAKSAERGRHDSPAISTQNQYP
eukprot:139353-Pyramimonas_sp.AAC.2